jgi:hypothetical protein
MTRIGLKITLGLVLSIFLVGSASADATITIDGDLSEWPADAFGFTDSQGDMPPPYADILQIMATNDNTADDNGYLYLGIEFYGDFRPNVGQNDVDVFIYLDINGDGDTDDPEDRIIEVTGDSTASPPTLGAVWDGTGTQIAEVSTSDWAYDGEFLEARIPYSVLGLTYDNDSFGLATGISGHPNIVESAPAEGEGDDGFIIYDGGDIEPLAVRMVGMSASPVREGVLLEWATGSERGNAGFNVFRLDEFGRRVRLTQTPIPGQVDSALGANYSFLDTDGGASDRYQIEDVALLGRNKLHGPVIVGSLSGTPVPRMRPRLPVVQPIPVAERKLSIFSWSGRFRLPAPAVKLAVEREGLHFIGFDDLAAAGLDSNAVRSAGLMLERRAEPVLALATAEGFWFVGVPRVDRYADYEVLTARAGRGASMETRWVEAGCADPRASVAHRLSIEKNLTYYVASPTEDPFYWAWAFEGIPAELAFDTPHPESGDSIRIDVCGSGVSAGPDHRVTVSLNGVLLGESVWEGRDIQGLAFSLPEGLLRQDGNAVAVEVLSGADVVFADRIVVSYRRALRAGEPGIRFRAERAECLRVDGLAAPEVHLLDVTDPAEPVVLTGFDLAGDGRGGYSLRFADPLPRADGRDSRTYLVAALPAAPVPRLLGSLQTLNTSRLAADYLIVTHKDFMAAARQLSAFHQARGLKTRIVTTEQAYDTFGHGRPSPQSIREVIRAAQPAYVLLLGGATVDSNDYLGKGNTDFVPAAFVKTAGFGYEAAADGWYVPAGVAIGRLAVQNSAEALAVVEKITTWHDSHQPAGSALFVADRDEKTPACFEDMSDNLIGACVPSCLHPERLFSRLSQDPAGDFQALVGQGVDLVTFAGHAFLTGWSNPFMVTSESAGRLTNEHLFLLLSFSCFDGAFTGPWGESLSWAFVNNPHGGALAAAAASSLVDPKAVESFAEQILCRLTSGQAATLGEALAEAERTLSGLTPALDDVISSFNLLGDPATPNPWAE